jgi:hypothetical protein
MMELQIEQMEERDKRQLKTEPQRRKEREEKNLRRNAGHFPDRPPRSGKCPPLSVLRAFAVQKETERTHHANHATQSRRYRLRLLGPQPGPQ